MSYEVNLQARRIQTQDKKSIAFQAEKEDSDSEDDMAFIAKNFKIFRNLKRAINSETTRTLANHQVQYSNAMNVTRKDT